ncbi:phospholipid-translocating P-type ATPase [Basidiobolus meristosporus CBS 931.73]|uniref:Phospholipid-transporting ATPase n=1 Tax=Basidiobolus meristosporus CBS 931.73 TaxID=1314790 RepID=A0A1Y1XXZ7_9FUNG|nr:phospholipid-translocating P-type ATPase [Basidiobolus meristosporus CBS 931.73]|eukprot:ORX90627.1 phospholipid-translocating P-type ATPase [Basidiobolus meristosporus CBS 931.73]
MVQSIPGRKHILKYRQQAQRKRLEQTLLRSPSRHSSLSNRRIFVNIPLPESALDQYGFPKTDFPSNRIRTSKYTLFTFLPKNLFEQFHRAANLYFVFLVILQLLPWFAVGSPAFVVLPIAVVMAITAIKDGFEDWRRHTSDKRYNSSKTKILQQWENSNYLGSNVSIWRRVQRSTRKILSYLWSKFGWFSRKNVQNSDDILDELSMLQPSPVHAPNAEFTEVLWQDVRVGDFIYLRNNQPVPADMVILATSEEDGECYVETKELDGETNLKTRIGLDETAHIKTAQDCVNLQCFIESDLPSSNLFTYQATMHIFNQAPTNQDDDDAAKGPSLVPININNTLLRGHVLRNTEYVIGMIIFSGGDTKIMLNSGNTPSKRSRIEKTMNQQIIINFGILIVLCLICGIAGGYNQKNNSETIEGAEEGSPAESGFVTFWASLIIFQNIIPISLYVSIEFIKTMQAFFIFQDIEMYYKPTDSVCIPKSWNLSDDLGQIEYVFSDKTGTLTRNIMEFSRCSINGRSYGMSLKGETDAAKGAKVRAGLEPADSRMSFDPEKLYNEFIQAMKSIYTPKYANTNIDTMTFADPNIFREMKADDGASDLQKEHAQKIREFFILLAVCHTVIIEKSEGDAEYHDESNQLQYRAESPDENALVTAAKDLGFSFLGRNKDSITIDVLGEELTFQLLQVLEFNSTRKRMSVIVRRPKPWNDIVLFCKGADNVIFERLADNQEEIIQTTAAHIDGYSTEGLRTLCLGYKVISEDEYTEWEARYHQASTTLDGRDEEMELCCSEIEKELLLIGATAIEDKLQEQVPDCILSLREAGMKVWVLTGDKMETAINIGFACNLLTNDMGLWTIRGDDIAVAKEQFLSVVANIRGFPSALDPEPASPRPSASYFEQLPLPRRSSAYPRQSTIHALVIDGSALKFILDDMETRALLLEIAPLCHSVICCRTSPLQKAQVVHLIRKGRNAVCLAIGDGANDVSMIQAADVGVAISGEEGLQAAMASDYTISQFRFLKNLLLVHGFWSYLRIAEMILNSFYKNVIWVLAVLWYQFFCGFSANLFYDYVWIQLYNLIFTTVSVVIIGCCDQAVGYEHALDHPSLYKIGMNQTRYGMVRFWVYILEGLYQSAVCYFAYYFLYTTNIVSWSGYDAGNFDLSSSVAVTLITIVNLQVGMNAYSWNWMMFTSVILSIAVTIVFELIYTLFSYNDSYGSGIFIYKSPSFWLTFLGCVVVSMLPRYLVLFTKQMWYYEDLDIVREIEKFSGNKKLSKESPSKLELYQSRNSSEQPEKELNTNSEEDLEMNQIELSIRSQ